MKQLLKRHKLLALLGAALALVGGVALAAWLVITITTIGPSTFSTNTAQTSVLKVRDTTTCSTDVTANIWPATTLADPGTRAEGQLCLRILSGDPKLIYSIQVTNTNATLAAGLTIRVTSAGTNTGGSPPVAACQFPSLNLDGTRVTVTQSELYYGPLSGLVVGDPALGQQAGDRLLGDPVIANTEKLCFSVVLPTTAPVSLSALSNSTNVLFDHQPQ